MFTILSQFLRSNCRATHSGDTSDRAFPGRTPGTAVACVRPRTGRLTGAVVFWGPPCLIIAGLGDFGSGDWAKGVAMPNKKTCPGGQVFLKSRLSRRHRRAGGEAFTFDLGQFHVFSFQAAGLGTGRTLPVVGLFQLAMSFCHDFKS